MSHFTVTVCLPPEAGKSAEALNSQLDKVLARYDENREVEPYLNEDGRKTTYNPESKWDWWVIGGRWRGYFLAKREAPRESLLFGESGAFDNAADVDILTGLARPDGGRLRDLDLDAMRNTKGCQAEEDWNTYAMVIQGTPEPLKWGHFYEQYEGAEGAMPCSRLKTIYDAENEVNRRYGMPEVIPFSDIPKELNYGPDGDEDGPYWVERQEAEERLKSSDPDAFTRWESDKKVASEAAGADWDAGLSCTLEQARADYAAQPRVRAVRESDHYKTWLLDDPVAIFDHMTRDEYVQQQRDRAVPGYATITLNGEWLAPGRMGWFGASSDDETSYEMYARHVNKMIDQLPGDTILVALDCHI